MKEGHQMQEDEANPKQFEGSTLRQSLGSILREALKKQPLHIVHEDL